jgi:hypothetical protein
MHNRRSWISECSHMFSLGSVARWLMIAGLIMVGFGALLWVFSRTGVPLGRLPGDLRIERENVTCLIPIASSILLSILLTLLINIVIRWLK